VEIFCTAVQSAATTPVRIAGEEVTSPETGSSDK